MGCQSGRAKVREDKRIVCRSGRAKVRGVGDKKMGCKSGRAKAKMAIITEG